MRCVLLLFLLAAAVVQAQTGPVPVGSWREHLPYGGAVGVAASPSGIYTATPYSLFRFDKATGEVERLSKVTGLSETGVRAIAFDAVSAKLFIGYTNSNIDVLTGNGLRNIPDLRRETVAGDKSIYHIYPANRLCYLSTGLGVVVLDAEKYEVRDSWFIGRNGNGVKTFMFTRTPDTYYAATEEGLKSFPAAGTNPADFQRWNLLSGTNGLPQGACTGVVTLDNQVIAVQKDTLFVRNGSRWDLFYAGGWPVVSINASGNRVTVCERTASGDSRVTVLLPSGGVERVLQRPRVISFPMQALVENGEAWVADLYGGLSRWQGTEAEAIWLNAPEGPAFGELAVFNNVVYAAAGSVNEAWNYQYNGNGLYRLQDGAWTNFNGFRYPELAGVLDLITLAVDPRDASVWAGSFGGGLLHIKEGGSFERFHQGSPLGQTIGDPGSYRVSGLSFDRENNLWISNFGAPQYLHVRKANGDWHSFTAPFFLRNNAVGQILIDDADQKWIQSPQGNGLIAWNHGRSVEDPSDDRWQLLQAGAGNGNLPSNTVLSLAKDRFGFIWVGTNDGIGVLQCPESIFERGCEAVLPVATEGNFANFLFKGEEVRSIAVDGANRKWVATRNGAWLLSPEGDKVLAHFTEAGSPLLSNDVKRVAINGQTGEVFFATANGLCSFRGAATDGSEPGTSSLLVYPNPVPPGYGGTIAIKGLPENAFVSITEPNGRLVYQARALGGQAVWNGRDYKGGKISTGIYIVLVTDEARTTRATGKIVFISN